MNLRNSQATLKMNAAAQEELDRITKGGQSFLPPRRQKMLRYIVEETLAGRGSTLTAVPIAISVFGRDESFDHKSDPVVRIEARRLRRDLAAYYSEAGKNNPVRISIPKGKYVAHFDTPASPIAENEAGVRPLAVSSIRQSWGLFAIGILTVFMVASAVLFLRPRFEPGFTATQPSVLVKPFLASAANTDIATGLSYEIVNELMRIPGIRVMAQSALSYAPDSIARDAAQVSYFLEGNLVANPSELTVRTRLVRSDDNTVVWSGKYTGGLTAGKLQIIKEDIASDIASRLGQTYGVINTDLSGNIDLSEPKPGSYRCILKAYHYRGNPPGEDMSGSVQTCLEKTVLDEPNYAEAWALLALHYNDSIRFNRVSPAQFGKIRTKAFEAASRAMALDPKNARAALALSAIYFYRKDYERSETYGRLAVQNDPNNPEMRALLGFRMVMRGNIDDGTPLLESAVAQSISPPSYMFQIISIDRLMRGDGNGMLEMAQRGTRNGSALSYALVATAYGLLGNKERAGEALRRMEEISPGYDPINRMKVHQASNEVLDAMTQALRRGGWQTAEQARLQTQHN